MDNWGVVSRGTGRVPCEPATGLIRTLCMQIQNKYRDDLKREARVLVFIVKVTRCLLDHVIV